MNEINKVQFLHVSIDFKGEVNTKTLKDRFNLGLNWIHYMPNCWIVKTKSSAQKWYERLKPYIGSSDNIFICRIDLKERQGWLPKWVWEWIRENQN